MGPYDSILMEGRHFCLFVFSKITAYVEHAGLCDHAMSDGSNTSNCLSLKQQRVLVSLYYNTMKIVIDDWIDSDGAPLKA